jgi:iron complex outermembrane receptor protein
MNKFTLLCATSALVMPSMAFAQSTGSTTVEEEEIVVTGVRGETGVGGIVVPDVPKTRSVLTSEILERKSDGQSILQAINLIPGVNYTNTDPYGSSGGNLRIRGFPGNRIAFLLDGLPLNDTGNYAIFGNQQVDLEVIDQVSVNLGTTDVDSPTPSAAGGVISYRTLVPSEDFHVMLKGSMGDFDYFRAFGMVQTGSFTSFGTRAWLAASEQQYEKFRGPGKLHKTQYNGRVYQPLGSSGDFVSLAGHWNVNRNNSYNSGLASDYAVNRDFDNIPICVRDAPTPGVADNDGSGSSTNNAQPASCTNYYNLRINPSNTGNLRGSMRFTLADGLYLTADPGYQSVLANGGGTTTVSETDARLRGATPATHLGVDLNGDGDIRDTVRLYQPSNTRTNRYTFLTSLIWEATKQHRFRVAYSYDRGEHRQTGEFGNLYPNGDPISVFGGKYNERARVVTADGTPLQNRDRTSIALLNQLSGEYFGRFMDNRLTFTVGIRAPFFERRLDQNCYTTVSSGAVLCTTEPIAASRILDPSVPRTGAIPANALYAPFERTVKYSPILPSGGISFDLTNEHSVYASYGKNFSSPSTDNLYRSVNIDVKPETTDAFEGGYRFRSRGIQAQLATYLINYKNRIVTAQDLDPASQTFGSTLDRNVGSARNYGFDGQVSWKPIRELLLYGFATYTHTQLRENVFGTATATAAANSPCPAGTPVGSSCQVISVLTEGNEFVETPKWQFGGRVQVDVGPVSVGVDAKYVGRRWSTDDNGRTLALASSGGQTAGQPFILTNLGDAPISPNGRTDSYTTVDADARISLESLGLEKTSLRLSVLNVFDKYYFGNINTQSTLSGGPRYSIGSPRTFQASVTVGF